MSFLQIMEHFDIANGIICQWLKERNALFDPGKILSDKNRFEDLVSKVGEEVKDDPVEIAFLTSLCVLGPRNGGSPPLEVCEELLKLVQQLPPREQAQRCIEIGIAYGSSGWPTIRKPPPETPWHGEWGPAFQWIKGLVRLWVYRSFVWLSDTVLDFERVVMNAWDGNQYVPMLEQRPILHEIEMMAIQITHMLICGVCDCFMLDGVKQNKPNLKRQIERHLREHQLVAWNPSKVTLWNFIAQAVKGSITRGHQQFATGSFKQGMLYPILHRDDPIKLSYKGVLHKYCPFSEKLYEGDNCPHCSQGHAFEPSRDAAISMDCLIIPKPNGSYMPEPWWHCDSCEKSPRGDNYFLCRNCLPTNSGIKHSEEHDRCPLCKREHNTRAKVSWPYIRQFDREYQMDWQEGGENYDGR